MVLHYSQPLALAAVLVFIFVQPTTLAQLKTIDEDMHKKLNKETSARAVVDSITKDENMHASQHRSKPLVSCCYVFRLNSPAIRFTMKIICFRQQYKIVIEIDFVNIMFVLSTHFTVMSILNLKSFITK